MTDAIQDSTRLQIRRARGNFIAMAATYFLGSFNDNFFKQAAILLAIAADKAFLQGYATVIFTLPFLVFAGHAGWLADRFPKRNVVIGCKILEFAAVLCGALGILYVNWWLMFSMLGIMGLQATVFSPSLNGSIPELYPASYIVTANALVKMASTAAILLGVALAGFVLAIRGEVFGGIATGRAAVAAVVVAVSAFGILVSLGVPRRRAADPQAPFPTWGPWATLKVLYEIRKDRLLAIVILADAFVWFAGSLQVQLTNVLGVQQFKLGESWTGGLIAAELLGIAVGGLLSSRLARGQCWYRVLAPALLLMATFMVLIAFVPAWPAARRLPVLFFFMGAMGLAGGAALIPLESFIQIRPVPERKGAVIAAGNFAAFAAILISGPVANGLIAATTATTGFGLPGLAAILVAAWLFVVLRRKDLA